MIALVWLWLLVCRLSNVDEDGRRDFMGLEAQLLRFQQLLESLGLEFWDNGSNIQRSNCNCCHYYINDILIYCIAYTCIFYSGL